jgi:hypothetical protein
MRESNRVWPSPPKPRFPDLAGPAFRAWSPPDPTGATFQGIAFGDETGRRGALGGVAAWGFHDATRQQIEAMA